MGKKAELHSINTISKLSDFAVINDNFTRCRCRVFYTGRNRNYSDITQEAVQKFIDRKGYANMPIVAHLKKDDNGNYKIGGHDYKITLDSDGNIEYTDETVPFGVIPEDCNPAFEEVTEKSGKVNSYFCVDIILWSHRYPIMEAAYSDNIYFNQSMEIVFNETHIDGEYIVVDDFSMSALCLLNKSNGEDNVEPCFQSAAVLKYSCTNDKGFKHKFNELLKQYNQICQKGDVTSQMKEKLLNALSDFKYTDKLGVENERYALIDMTENTVTVFDRQENGKTYIISYSVNDSGEPTLDTEARIECGITSCEKQEGDFDLSVEVERACTFTSNVKEQEISARIANSVANDKKAVEEANERYNKLKIEFDNVSARLDKYVKADEERARKLHEDEVDKVLADYEPKFASTKGRSEFLAYKLKADYSKSTGTIKDELNYILGKVIADGNTSTQCYSFVDSPINNFNLGNEQPAANKRYGDLIDRVQSRYTN